MKQTDPAISHHDSGRAIGAQNYLGDVAAADTIVCLEFIINWSKRWVDWVRGPAGTAEVGAGGACHKGGTILAETCRHVTADSDSNCKDLDSRDEQHSAILLGDKQQQNWLWKQAQVRCPCKVN